MNCMKPDLSKPTCRVCLKNKIDGEMYSIFDKDAELRDLRIYEKIECCAGIKIICGRKFPTFICCHCNEFLRISYMFRTTCHKSEEYLKLIAETEASQPKEEHLEENDLPKAQIASNENSIVTFKRSPSPLSDTFQEDQSNLSGSPARCETPFQEFLSENESDAWIDINYSDGDDSISCSENIDSSHENLELKTNEEIGKTRNDGKPLESKRRSYVRKKKSSSTLLKSLEISSNGPAIIKPRKPRAKNVDSNQPYVCEVCGNVYYRRHTLEHHVKRHRAVKEHECEICGYAFHSNCELRRHMRKHTGSRPYKCNYCPKAFGDHSTLTKHERVHRNERPYKCDICGSCFSYPGVLKRHKLVHTGEKPYKCEICSKCFNDRYHLQSHLKTIQHKNDPRVESLLQNIKENNV